MAHMVKCTICGERFDRDKIPAVKVSAKRYAHQHCKPDGEAVPIKEKEKDENLIKLEQYIMKLFNEKYVTPRIRKQINQYHQEYGYTYSGMLKTLIWWFDIKGNSIEKAKDGIGIIPYIYKDAHNYYYSIYLAKLLNESKDISKYKPKIKEIEITSPRTYVKPPKLFNFFNEEEN